MKKRFIVFSVFFLVMAIAFMNCDSDDDDGGSGAEFNPSSYYTRTEIDGFLSELDADIVSFDTSIAAVDLSDGMDSYANGNTITFDNTAIAGFVQISVTNSSGGDGYVVVYIGNDSENSAYTIYAPQNPGQQTMTTILHPLPSSGGLRVWFDEGTLTGTIGINYWIGAGFGAYIFKSHDE